MTNDSDHRARLERIIDLTSEALALCELCGDHLLAARLADSHDIATERLRRFDAR